MHILYIDVTCKKGVPVSAGISMSAAAGGRNAEIVRIGRIIRKHFGLTIPLPCSSRKKPFGALDKLIVAAPSGWLAERAKQSFLQGRRIEVVHNGIDIEYVFHPYDTSALREMHCFLYFLQIS